MLEHIQGDTIYIYDEFCGDGALYVEAIRTWCSTAKEKNGFHHMTHSGMTQLKDFHNFGCSRHEDENWVSLKTVVFKL